MPQPPRPIELETSSILLGVNHEHPTRTDHQVVNVRPAPGDGQVMQDHPPLPFQRTKQPSSSPLPRRTAPPGNGIRAEPEAQHPAGHADGQSAGEQSQPGRQQAAEGSPTGADPEDDGDPPGQSPDLGRPLGRPMLPPPRLGGAARPAHRGPDPDCHYRPMGVGAGQQLVGVAGEVGEHGLQS